MTTNEKIRHIIDISWMSFKHKVAAKLLNPENEKMMQLQFAQTLQTLTSIFEFSQNEAIKVLLEVPVIIARVPRKRIIDIVIQHSSNNKILYFPIELKCFRKFTRDGLGNRGAQNLGMYDYWKDIENIEQYTLLANYSFGTHLALTDDSYYVNGKHSGKQTSIYSTSHTRNLMTGNIQQEIANRTGQIEFLGKYIMTGWEQIGSFYFIKQETSHLI